MSHNFLTYLLLLLLLFVIVLRYNLKLKLMEAEIKTQIEKVVLNFLLICLFL